MSGDPKGTSGSGDLLLLAEAMDFELEHSADAAIPSFASSHFYSGVMPIPETIEGSDIRESNAMPSSAAGLPLSDPVVEPERKACESYSDSESARVKTRSRSGTKGKAKGKKNKGDGGHPRSWQCARPDCGFEFTISYEHEQNRSWQDRALQHLRDAHNVKEPTKGKTDGPITPEFGVSQPPTRDRAQDPPHATATGLTILYKGPHIVDVGDVPYFACPVCPSSAVFWTPVVKQSPSWVGVAVSHMVTQHKMDQQGATAMVTGVRDLEMKIPLAIEIVCGAKSAKRARFDANMSSAVGCQTTIDISESAPGPDGPNTLCRRCSAAFTGLRIRPANSTSTGATVAVPSLRIPVGVTTLSTATSSSTVTDTYAGQGLYCSQGQARVSVPVPVRVVGHNIDIDADVDAGLMRTHVPPPPPAPPPAPAQERQQQLQMRASTSGSPVGAGPSAGRGSSPAPPMPHLRLESQRHLRHFPAVRGCEGPVPSGPVRVYDQLDVGVSPHLRRSISASGVGAGAGAGVTPPMPSTSRTCCSTTGTAVISAPKIPRRGSMPVQIPQHSVYLPMSLPGTGISCGPTGTGTGTGRHGAQFRLVPMPMSMPLLPFEPGSGSTTAVSAPTTPTLPRSQAAQAQTQAQTLDQDQDQPQLARLCVCEGCGARYSISELEVWYRVSAEGKWASMCQACVHPRPNPAPNPDPEVAAQSEPEIGICCNAFCGCHGAKTPLGAGPDGANTLCTFCHAHWRMGTLFYSRKQGYGKH